MPVLKYTERDFGTPYKMFKDLKKGDIVYFVDLSDMSMREEKIETITVKDLSTPLCNNLLNVEYCVENNKSLFSQYDGYSFISDEKTFMVCTDERIAQSILNAIRHRNAIQWDRFTSIFGNPMGAYAHRSVPLC